LTNESKDIKTNYFIFPRNPPLVRLKSQIVPLKIHIFFVQLDLFLVYLIALSNR